MHKDEIKRLIGKVEQKGFTLVPLNLHYKGGRVKVEIALAKGKAEHDKRDTEKKRDWEREQGPPDAAQGVGRADDQPPKPWPRCPACWWPTATTTRRTCRSARAASAPAPASACAACAVQRRHSRHRPRWPGPGVALRPRRRQRVEVLRGPFSVLYGNSSGGVISAVQQTRPACLRGRGRCRQLRPAPAARRRGPPFGEGFDRAPASTMEIDGFRPHSEASARWAIRLGWNGGRQRDAAGQRQVDQPAAGPAGPDRASSSTQDPYQTTPQATRCSSTPARPPSQTQLGAQLDPPLRRRCAARAQLAAYTGQRASAVPGHPAGTQNRRATAAAWSTSTATTQGVEARLRWRWARPTWCRTAPSTAERRPSRLRELHRHRRRAGPTASRPPASRREQPRHLAGLRAGRMDASHPAGRPAPGAQRQGDASAAEDHYLSNGNDSGRLDFSYTNPVARAALDGGAPG
jgi:hypothetical protein